jgi:hypothetical protein
MFAEIFFTRTPIILTQTFFLTFEAKLTNSILLPSIGILATIRGAIASKVLPHLEPFLAFTYLQSFAGRLIISLQLMLFEYSTNISFFIYFFKLFFLLFIGALLQKLTFLLYKQFLFFIYKSDTLNTLQTGIFPAIFGDLTTLPFIFLTDQLFELIPHSIFFPLFPICAALARGLLVFQPVYKNDFRVFFSSLLRSAGISQFSLAIFYTYFKINKLLPLLTRLNSINGTIILDRLLELQEGLSFKKFITNNYPNLLLNNILGRIFIFFQFFSSGHQNRILIFLTINFSRLVTILFLYLSITYIRDHLLTAYHRRITSSLTNIIAFFSSIGDLIVAGTVLCLHFVWIKYFL